MAEETMASTLPHPSSLIWSHATNSLEKLQIAIENPLITAIEGDILMGWETNAATTTSTTLSPIMSHPPHRISDLTTARLLHFVTTEIPNTDQRRLNKHIKLDFKEIEALSPTMKEIYELGMVSDHYIAYLNADIVAGPGVTDQDVTVPADAFLQTCLMHMKQHKVVRYVRCCTPGCAHLFLIIYVIFE